MRWPYLDNNWSTNEKLIGFGHGAAARRPELKSDELFVCTPIVIEILSCEHFFTAEKVLPFIGSSGRGTGLQP